MSKIEKTSKLKKLLKITGTSCLALVLMVTLTGCSSKPKVAGPNELVVWGFVDEDAMKPIIKDFNATKKNVTVKYFKKNLDADYENASINSILSGQGPDVWAIPNDWVYRHKDKLAPVSDSLLKTKKVTPKDYFADFIIDDSTFDNKMYAMPASSDVLQVYYNTELLDAARIRARKSTSGEEGQTINRILNNLPATWEEMEKIVPWITVRSGNSIQQGGISIGTDENVTNSNDILSLLMIQNQTKMLSEDLTQSTFNLPIKNTAGANIFPGKNALDFYSKFSDPLNPSYTWNTSLGNDVTAFVEGKVTAIFAYSNLTSYLQQSYPQLQFKRGLVPQVGDLNPVVDYANYTTFVAPAASNNNVGAAWEFIISISTTSSGSYKSATKELSNKKYTGEDQVLKSRASSNAPSDILLNTMTTWNKGRYPVEVDEQLKSAISRVNNRSQSSQASLDTAAANITSLLRKETW